MQTALKPTESDPTGIDSHTPGAKLDAGKAPIFQGLLEYFPLACEQVALLSEFGARKYAWKGWEHVPDGRNRYRNALCRHQIKTAVEGPFDSDTRMLHETAIAWNALAALELLLREGHPARLPEAPNEPNT